MNSSHWHLPAGETDETKSSRPMGCASTATRAARRRDRSRSTQLERKLADAGVLGAKAGESGSGSVQQDEALRMLEEQEGINDELRAEIKALKDENARLKAALAKKQGKDS
jgi:uncharacterized small protein (DUF1192 family)